MSFRGLYLKSLKASLHREVTMRSISAGSPAVEGWGTVRARVSVASKMIVA